MKRMKTRGCDREDLAEQYVSNRFFNFHPQCMMMAGVKETISEEDSRST